MKKIIIFGTGGHMSEQLQWIEDLMDHKKIKFKILFCAEKKIFDKYDFIPENKIKVNSGHLYLAIGDPKIRLKLLVKFKDFNFFSMIHPSVILSKKAIVGKGVTISPNCIISPNVTIGNFNNLNCGVFLHHDTIIGDNNTFSPGVKILGNCQIGNSNIFGANACVKQKTKIGNFNLIGASSFVQKNIKDKLKVGGVPAKLL